MGSANVCNLFVKGIGLTSFCPRLKWISQPVSGRACYLPNTSHQRQDGSFGFLFPRKQRRSPCSKQYRSPCRWCSSRLPCAARLGRLAASSEITSTSCLASPSQVRRAGAFILYLHHSSLRRQGWSAHVHFQTTWWGDRLMSTYISIYIYIYVYIYIYIYTCTVFTQRRSTLILALCNASSGKLAQVRCLFLARLPSLPEKIILQHSGCSSSELKDSRVAPLKHSRRLSSEFRDFCIAPIMLHAEIL